MKRFLSGVPTIKFKDIFNGENKGEEIFPFNHNNCEYFFSARYALAGGLKALGIKAGEKVLIPSYNCGVELEPFYHFNIEPLFYKVDKHLRVDMEELVRIGDKNIKALMITHYLGFPQRVDEIEKYCKERNIYLIEDCAHSFLSSFNKKPLGSFGDIAIFSILKTLPVPNGGILVINRDELNYDREREKPNIFTTIFYMMELYHLKTFDVDHDRKTNIEKVFKESLYLLMKDIKHCLAAYKKIIKSDGLYLLRPDSDYFIEDVMKWGVSSFTLRIIKNTNFDSIKMMRKRNFKYLLDYFRRKKEELLLLDEISEEICPLLFPLFVESEAKRNRLYLSMKSRGIVTHPWWNQFHQKVPWDKYPDAVELKKRVFGLPIHQDLTIHHMDQIIDEFENIYSVI